MHMANHDRINLMVIKPPTQLPEHSVAAIEQNGRVVFLNQVAAAGAVGVLPRW